jgi:GLPGLI family protein
MKTKILIAALFCMYSFNSVKSQTLQVIYETQPKMQIKADGLDANIIEQIKKSSIIQNILCYNNGESVYKPIKKENGNSSGGITVKTSASEDVTYKNHKTKKEISYKDFFGKGFLIEEELKSDVSWTIVDSVKDIQGYSCTKATGMADEKEITVWFCPNLPVIDGPVYTGLNGLVMEVQSDNSSIVATEISDLADCEIAAPKKGKKTSKKDFDEMMKKRIEAMQREGDGVESGGDGNTITIKIK